MDSFESQVSEMLKEYEDNLNSVYSGFEVFLDSDKKTKKDFIVSMQNDHIVSVISKVKKGGFAISFNIDCPPDMTAQLFYLTARSWPKILVGPCIKIVEGGVAYMPVSESIYEVEKKEDINNSVEYH